MKLRDKEGDVSFTVVDPRTGHRTKFAPGDGLLTWQYEEMTVRPELIRQFAHELARRAAKAHPGSPRARVYARAMISLNGRKPQLMINPRVDLAAEPATLGTPSWVVPLHRTRSRREGRPTIRSPANPATTESASRNRARLRSQADRGR